MTSCDRSWEGWRFYRSPVGVRNKGLITQKNVKSACIRTVFKMKSWNFTRTLTTARDRSVGGWQFYRSLIGVRNKELIIQKREFDVHSHSFFKMKIWNFSGTSITPWDRSWKSWRSYRSTRGVRNKGLITQKKTWIRTCIRTVFKMKSWNFTGTSITSCDRTWVGWRFYRPPWGSEIKGLITQKTWIRRAFAQFSRWRVETSQERWRLPGTGR